MKPTTNAVYALILAGGSGVRFGKRGKLWQPLGEQPVWSHAVWAFEKHPAVVWIGLVVPPVETERYAEAVGALGMKKVKTILPGGATRRESAAQGVQSLPAEADWVAVHDAARPFLSQALLDRLFHAAYRWGAAIPALPLTDTVKRTTVWTGGQGDEETRGQILETLRREELVTVQTPQVFRAQWLRQAYLKAASESLPATDDATLIERLGYPVHWVEGDPLNVKLTRPEDWHYMEWIYKERESGEMGEGGNGRGGEWERGGEGRNWESGRKTKNEKRKTINDKPEPPRNRVEIRVGIGYDIHLLVKGRRLVLGGVEVPFSRGLLGHSDADVVVHAICDALLGAAGLGDIGQHFPDTDPRWRDISSLVLLREVGQQLTRHGWQIVHVDTMILAQVPRLSPHLPIMRERLAATLGIQPERISLKATTNEGLDAVGREEGIACHAVATIQFGVRD